MNIDDVISMHKDCEKVIEDISMMTEYTQGIPSLVDAQLISLRQSINSLATVQRDLLAAMIPKTRPPDPGRTTTHGG